MAATSRNRAGNVDRVARPGPPGPRPPRAAGAACRGRRRGTRPARRGKARRCGRARSRRAAATTCPPPISETIEELWCGARNGGRGDQAAARQRQPAGRVDPGRLQRLRRCRGRAGCPAGGWPAWSCPSPGARSSAGGGRRPPPPRPPTGPSGWPRTSDRSGGGSGCGGRSGRGRSGHGSAPVEGGDQLAEGRHGPDRARGPRARPPPRTPPAPPRRVASRASTSDTTPGHGADGAVEAELADERRTQPHPLGPTRPCGHQHRDGDGQVEPRTRPCGRPDGARLTVTRGFGNVETARGERRPHPVARLPARRRRAARRW